MKLWLITQNQVSSYDTFDSAIVAAETAAEAVKIHPESSWNLSNSVELWNEQGGGHTWCNSPDLVQAVEIGEASPGTQAGVILASFNAG